MSVSPAPKEAQLIAARRKSAVPRLSMRQAAFHIGISPGRWRQLELGSRRVGGMDFPERAPTDTLARMAREVGATPEELEEAGRDDAAIALRAMLASPRSATDELADAVERSPDLSNRQKETLIRLIRSSDLSR